MPTLHFLANPARFRRFAQRVLPALSVATALAMAVGLYWALMIAPPDYQQGETVRIMFIHVPSAWLGMAAKSSAPRFNESHRSAGVIWRITGNAVVLLSPVTICE